MLLYARSFCNSVNCREDPKDQTRAYDVGDFGLSELEFKEVKERMHVWTSSLKLYSSGGIHSGEKILIDDEIVIFYTIKRHEILYNNGNMTLPITLMSHRFTKMTSPALVLLACMRVLCKRRRVAPAPLTKFGRCGNPKVRGVQLSTSCKYFVHRASRPTFVLVACTNCEIKFGWMQQPIYLSNIGWEYTLADVADPSLFDSDFINACLSKKNNFSNEGFCHLHQWQLWQGGA